MDSFEGLSISTGGKALGLGSISSEVDLTQGAPIASVQTRLITGGFDGSKFMGGITYDYADALA